MLLVSELAQINELLPQQQQSNQHISTVPVRWHLQHVLLVIMRIISQLEQSNPDQYQKRFNLARTYIFTLGFIPRGRGRTPDVVNPDLHAESIEDLGQLLKQTKQQLNKLSQLAPRAHFKHPYFGVLNKKQTEKFLTLHTRHHLKIIKEIIT